MKKAKKVIASGGRVENFLYMDSRAAVSLCGRFLFEGEYDNPNPFQRNALITLKDRVSESIIGRLCLSVIDTYHTQDILISKSVSYISNSICVGEGY